MRVKSILFNTEMVQAILNGKKTCTRRIVKPQPKSKLCYTFVGGGWGTWGYPSPSAHEIWGEEYRLPNDITKEDLANRWKPPYHTDDILYVRETWCDDRQFTKDDTPGQYFYKASSPDDFEVKWKPSIHMPKEAARIWLKVTDVRVERLQEMSDKECIKEGIYPSNCRNCNATFGCDVCPDEGYDEVDEFVEVWDNTIKKSDFDRYGWDANPYVWVIEFERCEKPPECILEGYYKAPNDGSEKCLGYMYDDNSDIKQVMKVRNSYGEINIQRNKRSKG